MLYSLICFYLKASPACAIRPVPVAPNLCSRAMPQASFCSTSPSAPISKTLKNRNVSYPKLKMKYLKFHRIIPKFKSKGDKGACINMAKLPSNRFRGYLIAISDFIHKIFDYLSCGVHEPLSNRVLLRRLYNSGYLDDQKFFDLCEKSSNNNLDPEELPM